jgi:integration host factor subunit alpha
MITNTKKIDLIKNLSKKNGFSISFSKKLIEDFILILKYNIKSKNLNLKNLGTFKLIKKKKRIGRNPKTKKNYIITARKSLSFSASEQLLKNIDRSN